MLFSRGFVSRVSAPLAVLVGGGICNCVYLSRPWQADQRCSTCNGTGRTPGIAREIAKCQPVTEWVATDKEPSAEGGGFAWYKESEVEDDSALALLPGALFDALDGDDWRWSDGTVFKEYPTRELAIAALSRAIGEIAKQGEKV